MKSEKKSGAEREAPYTHLILSATPIIFLVIWVLDSFFLQWTTFLNNYVPTLIRIILFIGFLSIALFLIYKSHETLFHDEKPSDELITSGIFKYLRNPMYLGIMLIYISLICLSISLISVGVLIGIFFLYNWMVNFEEKILEEIFGDEYIAHKRKTGKWFPKFS